MANNAFLDATEYANVMLLLLKNNLVLGRLVNGQFKNEVTDENGLTINIKRPPQFIAKDGATLAEQPIVTGSTNVAVDRYKNVHVSVGDLEGVQSWNELMRNETVKSAASTLAHEVDSFLATLFLDFYSEVGTPGQVISSPAEFMPVHTRLMEQSVPGNDLSGVVKHEDGEKIRASLVGGNIDNVNRDALQRSRIPMLSEIDVHASQHVPVLTTGTRAGTPLVNGASQEVNYRDVKDTMTQSLILDGFGASETIKKGEVFTIANVNAWDNRGQQSLGRLQQFTVTADATADGGGNVTLTIAPAIIVQGTSDGVGTDTNTAFATVDAAPADNAAITFNASASTAYGVRAAFQKQAIALVSARLMTPFSDTTSFVQDPETGIGIRYWRGSDISTGKHIHRWDMIYGAKTVDRRLGARVQGVA